MPVVLREVNFVGNFLFFSNLIKGKILLEFRQFRACQGAMNEKKRRSQCHDGWPTG
jgi:hypothetical protein